MAMPSSDQKTIIRTIHELTSALCSTAARVSRLAARRHSDALTRDGFGPAWAGRLDIRLDTPPSINRHTHIPA
jgi:hypothetical protein